MTALQSALAAIDREAGSITLESSGVIRAKCRALVTGYDRRWSHAGYRPVQIDHLLTSELYNPETQRKSRTWTVAGLLDAVCLLGTTRVLFDHKTTSNDITDPNGSYWRQLAVEGQANHYMLLQWLNGERVDDVVWDVVRKPSISPRQLKKPELANVVAGGSYFGVVADKSTRLVYSQGGTDRETVDLYEARLIHDCTEERPDWYFQRRSIMRMDREILEYAKEQWQHGQNMLATENLAAKGVLPPRNSGACMLYGSPCKFLGICSGYDTPDSGKWVTKKSVHGELPQLEGDGRQVLTNSRIRCYQTCQRKHHYQYTLGIERIDDEEREALVFGSLYHAGLRAWWSTFLEVGNVNHDESCPAAGVGSLGGNIEPQLAQ